MIIQFLKNNHVIILNELSFTYRWVKYTIEKWFITNGWSIPRILWAISHPFFYPFICAYLIHDYIINEYMDMWMLLLLVFVMLFLFLYLSYTLLKNIKNVVIANKYIRKGGNHEDKERS